MSEASAAGGAGRLVTGEAVELGLHSAKLPSRALAAALDGVVYIGGYLVVSIVLIVATASLDEAAVLAVYVTSLVLVLIGVPIAVETLTRGRSLGKLACGLRVVRDDGGPIRFRHALVRGAVGVVEIQMFLGVIACIASLVSARGRRIGDVFAGTLVVRERIPVPRSSRPLPPAPPWLAEQLTGVDLSGVPEGLWLAVRQYLSRVHQLDPQVGWSMAERLAGDVVACTGAPVPEGTPPAVFLAAVVAERQVREARRVFGAPVDNGVEPGDLRVVEQGQGGVPVPSSVGWVAPGADGGVLGDAVPPVRGGEGASRAPVSGSSASSPSAESSSTGFVPPA
ncbi:RDD family protein [Actinacidiphila sp. bgisy160]|uniref:RDD family protein n=1 Tax=Actinacidiphila sp. bgisy160 TaxID=3413796 RepID=UPI003D7582B0